MTKDENNKNVPRLEIPEVVLTLCNIINNDYQQDSRALYTSNLDKSLGELLDILPKQFMFLKPFNSEFSYIDVWFTAQNTKSLEIEDKINKNDKTFSST